MQHGLTLHWFGSQRFLRHLQQVLLRSQHRSHSEFPNWAIRQTNTHSINPVWAVNTSSWRAQRHCIAAGFFSGQGREFKVNTEEEEKADARLERRRETKAGKYLFEMRNISFLYYALNAVMQLTNSIGHKPEGRGWVGTEHPQCVGSPALLWAASCQGTWAAGGHRAALAGGHQATGVPSNSQAQNQSFSAPLSPVLVLQSSHG